MFKDITTPQGFAIMGTVLAFLLAYMGDTYTTMIGLQHGFVEGNPLNRWLFKKIGITLTAFIEAVGVLWLGAFLSNYGWGPSAAFFGALAGGETFWAVRNYLKLKAAKISLK